MTKQGIEPLLPEDPAALGGYRTLGRLGAGGMGVVYLGMGPDGRQVAVKVIRREFATDPGYRARFETEVANARRVASFCTAAVLAYGEQDGVPFLVTEFVPGMSLKEYVEKHGAFPPAQLRGLVIGIATALLAIHTARLVHRDLKPHNVLLAVDGPRVIDFGIARATDATTQHTATGVVVGSPGWIAPEQLFEGKVTTACDIFAWGSLVAYAATGRHPYGEGNMMVLAVRAQQGAHDLSGVPHALLPLVEAALDPNPVRRPTGEQVLTELLGTAAEQEAQTQISSVWNPDFLPSSARTFTGLASTLPPPLVRTQPPRSPAQQPSGATWVATNPSAPSPQQGFASASAPASLQPGAYPDVHPPHHAPPQAPLPPKRPPQGGRNRWIGWASAITAVALAIGLGGYFGRDLLQKDKPGVVSPGTTAQGSLFVAPDAAAKALNDAVPIVEALYSYSYKEPGSFDDENLPVDPSFRQQWAARNWPAESRKDLKAEKWVAKLELSSLGVISAAADRVEALVSGTSRTTSDFGRDTESIEARVRLVQSGGSWIVEDITNVDENQEPVQDSAALWPDEAAMTVMRATTDCLVKYLDIAYETKELHKNTARSCLAERALSEDLPAWQNQISQNVVFYGTVLDTAFQMTPSPSADPVLLVSTKTVKRSGIQSELVYGVIWRLTMKQMDGIWRAVRVERLGKFE